jgi:acetyl-CoA acyltransferase
MTRSVVLAGYKRSPFHFAHKGKLATVRPDDLAAYVIRALVDESGVEGNDIEDLILGCAFPEAEQGFNLARLLVGLTDLPKSVAGTTVNRFCGSSMQSIHMAAGAIHAGMGDVFIAAGVESMSRVPMTGYNPMPNPTLYEDKPGYYMSMGHTAENIAKKYDIDRDVQDQFAYQSHKRAAAAHEAGSFKSEIVPIPTGDDMVDQDGCIRPDTSPEKLGELSPSFDQHGSVTAGTSSPLTDGAVAVLVASEEYAEKHDLEILARITSMAVAGCDPTIMGIGPVPAAQKALKRADLSIRDMDVVELNEAFAAQSLAVIHDLELDPEIVNIDGGAIALGHPLGASGGRITAKAADILTREGGKYALATMCIGGGQGIATILESV